MPPIILELPNAIMLGVGNAKRVWHIWPEKRCCLTDFYKGRYHPNDIYKCA